MSIQIGFWFICDICNIFIHAIKKCPNQLSLLWSLHSKYGEYATSKLLNPTQNVYLWHAVKRDSNLHSEQAQIEVLETNKIGMQNNDKINNN